MSSDVKTQVVWLPDGFGGGGHAEVCRASDYAVLEAENARLVERTGYLVEFAQQMARQQGEPYYRLLAKAALKKWSGL